MNISIALNNWKVLFSLLLIMQLLLTAPVLAETNVATSSQKSDQALVPSATAPHIQVSLLSDKAALVPGQTIMLGVLFEPDPQWHTYWRNPGDSGEAPTIAWQSETELDFGDIQWPIPKAIPVAHLVNYGFESNNLLMVPVTVPNDAVLDTSVQIIADVSWLVCKEDCIPGWATLAISLPVSQQAQASPHADLFAQSISQLPKATSKSGYFEITDSSMVFEVPELSGNNWHLFPFRSDVIQHAAVQQIVNVNNAVQIVVPRSDYFYGQPESLNWLISNGSEAYYVNGVLSDASISEDLESEDIWDRPIWIFALMAFAGGLILNLMPCVLPILSIKAMAMQNMSNKLSHKFAYLFGVLFCFNIFALLIIVLQLGGQQIGWGFHMQEPVVVALLAFLFTFIALILLDAIAVGSRFSNLGNSLVNGESAGSHFATGLLAVIVASPCTAPFMAAALGIAFVSEAPVTLLLFNALALGFALPLTLLFMWSKAKAWLPQPGPWMVSFKHFLAFPMFATVAWLVWVFAGQMGAQLQFLLLLALIMFCMCIWLLGIFKNPLMKAMVGLGLLVSITLPIWVSLSAPSLSPEALSQDMNSKSEAFDRIRLQALKNANEVVLVNMTADWCITCKVNEQVVLSSGQVIDALSQDNVTYMVGDWTNKNDEIFSYLSEYNRAGVPLYVVYAGDQSKQVLPQILTPKMVIDAINQAKKELNDVN